MVSDCNGSHSVFKRAYFKPRVALAKFWELMGYLAFAKVMHQWLVQGSWEEASAIARCSSPCSFSDSVIIKIKQSMCKFLHNSGANNQCVWEVSADLVYKLYSVIDMCVSVCVWCVTFRTFDRRGRNFMGKRQSNPSVFPGVEVRTCCTLIQFRLFLGSPSALTRMFKGRFFAGTWTGRFAQSSAVRKATVIIWLRISGEYDITQKLVQFPHLFDQRTWNTCLSSKNFDLGTWTGVIAGRNPSVLKAP